MPDRSIVLLVVVLTSLLVPLAPSAAGQIETFAWTLDGQYDGYGFFIDGTMYIEAGFSAPAGSIISYTTVTPVAGQVNVHAFAMPWDGECDASVPVLLKDGVDYVLGTCFYSDDVSFHVEAGQSFGFGIKTLVPTWPAATSWSEFTFTPDSGFAYWTDEGGALAGFSGEPVLTGIGLLHDAMPVTLQLSDARPHAPVVLVVGLTAANAPFKGGVLVPAPDLLFPGLGTDLDGALSLVATWPAGIPSGASLWLHAWIVDPDGPVGWAASNALRAQAP